MPKEEGRIKIILSEDVSALIREEQERLYSATRLRVPYAEIARSRIMTGYETDTRYTVNRVSDAAGG